MEANVLETIYTADLSNLEQGSARAQSVFNLTTNAAQKSTDRVEVLLSEIRDGIFRVSNDFQNFATTAQTSFSRAANAAQQATQTVKSEASAQASAVESGAQRINAANDDIRTQFGIHSGVIRRTAKETFDGVANDATQSAQKGAGAFGAYRDAAQAALAAAKPDSNTFAAFEKEHVLLDQLATDSKNFAKEQARAQAVLTESTKVLNNARDVQVKHTNDLAIRQLKEEAREARNTGAAYQNLSRQRRVGNAAVNLASNIPGGQRLAQAKFIADDVKELSSGLGTLAAPAAVAVGSLAVVTAGIVALDIIAIKSVKSFTDYAAHIHDIGVETGLTAETTSTLGAAAELAGVGINRAVSSVDIYLKNLSEAAHGNKETAKTFQRFGIDAKTAIQDPDQAIKDLLNKLASIPNSAERMDAAFKLAGRSGKDLARIAIEMGGNFAKFQQQAREWGIVLSEQDVKAADKLQDAVTVLGFKINSIMYSIARGALPEVQKALDAVTQKVGGSGQYWEDFGRSAGSALGGTISLLDKLNTGLEKYLAYRRAVQAFLQSSTPNEAIRNVEFAMRPDVPDTFGPGSRTRSGDPYANFDPKTKTFVNPDATGGIGNVTGGGGANSAESTARRAARQALESAQIDLRQAESVFQGAIDVEKRSYDLHLQNLDEYNQNRVEAENKRFEAVQAVFEKEREAAKQFPTGAERELKLKDINQRAEAAELDHQQTLNGYTDDFNRERLQKVRNYGQALIAAQEEINRTLEATFQASTESGLKTFADAQKTIYTASLAVRKLQAGELRKQLEESLGGDLSGLKDALKPQIDELFNAVLSGDDISAAGLSTAITDAAFDKDAAGEVLLNIRAFLEQIKQAQLKNTADTKKALADDLATRQSYAQKLQDIGNQIRDNWIEIYQNQLAPLEGNYLRRTEFIKKSADLEVDIERDRGRRLNDERKAELERLNVYIQENIGNVEELRKQKKALQELIISDEKVLGTRIEEIRRKEAEELKRTRKEIAADLADMTSNFLEAIPKGGKAALDALLDDVKSTLNQISRELMKGFFEKLIVGETQGSDAGGIVGAITNKILGVTQRGKADDLPAATNQNTQATDENTRAIDELTRSMQMGGTGIPGASGLAGAFMDATGAGLSSVSGTISGLFSSLFGAIGGLFGGAGSVSVDFGGFTPDVPAFASGGEVFGPGTSTSDSILARLSASEHVTNARSSSAAGDAFMQRLNAIDSKSQFNSLMVSEAAKLQQPAANQGENRFIFAFGQAEFNKMVDAYMYGPGGKKATVHNIRYSKDEVQMLVHRG